jgi:hypothetical protein
MYILSLEKIVSSLVFSVQFIILFRTFLVYISVNASLVKDNFGGIMKVNIKSDKSSGNFRSSENSLISDNLVFSGFYLKTDTIVVVRFYGTPLFSS